MDCKKNQPQTQQHSYTQLPGSKLKKERTIEPSKRIGTNTLIENFTVNIQVDHLTIGERRGRKFIIKLIKTKEIRKLYKKTYMNVKSGCHR